MRTKRQSDRKPWQFQPGHKWRWRPGQSGGNQGGRSGKDARKLAEEFGAEVMKNGLSRDEHLLALLYRQACQGSVRATELYLAYRYGKPTQVTLTAELSTEEKVAAMDDDQIASRINELLERMSAKGKTVQ